MASATDSPMAEKTASASCLSSVLMRAWTVVLDMVDIPDKTDTACIIEIFDCKVQSPGSRFYVGAHRAVAGGWDEAKTFTSRSNRSRKRSFATSRS